MAKETEKRLIKTLRFLQEPHGSTIPTLVKAMNGEGPQVSLKKIVQTLKGCLDTGILKVSDGRIKFKQFNLDDQDDEAQIYNSCGSTWDRYPNICDESRPLCSSNLSQPKYMKSDSLRLPTPSCLNPDDRFNGYLCSSKICVADGEPPEAGGDGEGGNGDPPPPKIVKPKSKCPKPKPKCPKPKPKCPKPKPKCPKPKPKCPKPKPKCPKPKPKCPKPKPKCPKKIAKKKIQPYCKKKKKCDV